MNLITLNDILPEARKNKSAIGHFNVNGQLWMESILNAGQTKKSPIIVATSDRMVDYLGGFTLIKNMLTELVQKYQITVPIVLHLDHGQTIERCIQAINAGYTSVMFDGSHKLLAENIALTKQVTDYAHNKGVSVEAEIGTVGGNEDGVIGGIQYANFDECLALSKTANIDALAAALGSVHGRYVGEPKLGFKEMTKLSENLAIPLVLHGASGIPADQVKKAIRLGHAKINVNTELNIAWRESLQTELLEHPSAYEPKILLENSRKAITQVVETKIEEFRSKE